MIRQTVTIWIGTQNVQSKIAERIKNGTKLICSFYPSVNRIHPKDKDRAHHLEAARIAESLSEQHTKPMRQKSVENKINNHETKFPIPFSGMFL